MGKTHENTGWKSPLVSRSIQLKSILKFKNFRNYMSIGFNTTYMQRFKENEISLKEQTSSSFQIPTLK